MVVVAGSRFIGFGNVPPPLSTTTNHKENLMTKKFDVEKSLEKAKTMKKRIRIIKSYLTMAENSLRDGDYDRADLAALYLQRWTTKLDIDTEEFPIEEF